jgi:hypothetical protein
LNTIIDAMSRWKLPPVGEIVAALTGLVVFALVLSVLTLPFVKPAPYALTLVGMALCFWCILVATRIWTAVEAAVLTVIVVLICVPILSR